MLCRLASAVIDEILAGVTKGCDACGAHPVAFRFMHETLCHDGAFQRGAEWQGVAQATIETMGHCVVQLRDAEVDDAEIRRALDELLQPDRRDMHGDDTIDLAAMIVGDCKREERAWASAFEPIGGQSGPPQTQRIC